MYRKINKYCTSFYEFNLKTKIDYLNIAFLRSKRQSLAIIYRNYN